MPIMTFEVPDEVARAFNEAFAGQNEDEIAARLLRRAIADKLRPSRRSAAVDAIFELRSRFHEMTVDALRKSRATGRP